MKVTIEIEGSAEEFQEMFVPSDKQNEFITKTYDAYVEALQKMVMRQIDPHNFTGLRNAKSS